MFCLRAQANRISPECFILDHRDEIKYPLLIFERDAMIETDLYIFQSVTCLPTEHRYTLREFDPTAFLDRKFNYSAKKSHLSEAKKKRQARECESY